MSATAILDTAPLGALIRYTDSSPKPPARFPDDGPAGDLIRYMGHHGMRPVHVHIMVSHDGYRRLIS